MKEVTKLETLVASWYKGMPHLPANGQKWLADNVWWLVLIGAIFGAIAILAIVGASFFASTMLVAFGGAYGAVVGGVAMIATLLFVALGALSLVLTVMAINPLKAGQKKGWTLLFIVALINVLSLAIDFLTSFNFFGLIWGLLAVAVSTYFLFEIRGHFAGAVTSKASKRTIKKAA